MIAKVLAALAALTTVALAGDKYLIQDGPDLGLTHRRLSTGEGAALGLRTSSGDFACRIKLRINADQNSSEVRVRLADGRVIPSSFRLDGRRGDWAVDIAPLNTGEPRAASFTWPAGAELRVIVVDSRAVSLVSWEVFDSARGLDSSTLARWRRVSYWAVLVLLCATAVSAVAGVFRRPEPAASDLLTPEHCIRAMIRSIDGRDQEKARAFLSKVLLERAGIDDALEQCGFESRAEKRAFFFRTVNNFKSRLENFRSALSGYLSVLSR